MLEKSKIIEFCYFTVPVGGSKKALGGGKRPGTGMRTSVVSMTSQTEVPEAQLTGKTITYNVHVYKK